MGKWTKDSSGNWKKSSSSKNYKIVNGKKVENTAPAKSAPATSNDTWNKDTVTLAEAAQQTKDVDRGIINVNTGATSLQDTPSSSISLTGATKQTETEKRQTAAESANSLISGTVTETTTLNGDTVTKSTETTELHRDLSPIKVGGKIRSAAQLGTVVKKSTHTESWKNPFYKPEIELGSPEPEPTEKTLTSEQADRVRTLLGTEKQPSGTGQEGTISQKPGATAKFSATNQLIQSVVSGAKYGWDSENNPMTVKTFSADDYKSGYGIYKKGVAIADIIKKRGTQDISNGVDAIVAANKYNPLSVVPSTTLGKLSPATKKLLTGAVVNTTAGVVQGASAVPLAAEAAVKEPKKLGAGLVFGAGVVVGSTARGLKDDPLTTIGELAGSVALGKIASGKPLAKPSKTPAATKVTKGTGTASLNGLYEPQPPKSLSPGMDAGSLEFAKKIKTPEATPLYSLSDMVMKKQARLTLNTDLSGKLMVEKTKVTGAPTKVIKAMKTSKPKRNIPETEASKAMRERLKSPAPEELYSLYDLKTGKHAHLELTADKTGTGLIAKKAKIKGTTERVEALNSRIGELRETRFNIEELTDRLGQDIGAAQLGIEIGKGGLKGTKAAKKVTGQSIPKVNKAGKKVKTLEDIGKVKNTGSGGGVMASKDGLLLEQVQVPKQLQKTTAKPKEKVSTTTKEKQALETRQKQKAAMKQKAANKSKLIQSINAANIFAATQVQGLNVMQRQLIVPLQSTKQIQGQAQATKQKREQKQRIAYAAKSMQVAIPTVKQKQQQTVREITRQEPKQAERTLTDSIAVPRSVWRSKAETLPPVAAPMPKRSKKSKKSYDMGVIHKTSKNAFKDIWELI